MKKFGTWKKAGIVSLLCAATAIVSPAQTFTTLLDFENFNGYQPAYMSLVQGTDGNFYGTTTAGGAYGNGAVFKVTPAGVLTTLHSFCASVPRCSDGYSPWSGLLLAADGSFYGTTSAGGAYGGGTIFNITSDGTLTAVLNFSFKRNGVYPVASLTWGADGDLYGTTSGGGRDELCDFDNCGIVFKLDSHHKLTILHDFEYYDGGKPTGSLVQGVNGYFYGTTWQGGGNDAGTVFKMTPDGKFTTLYSFTGKADGSNPWAGLTLSGDGSLYGTTAFGGDRTCIRGGQGCGTTFKITPSGELTTVHTFEVTDGAIPYDGLTRATDGNFYGMTAFGGTLPCLQSGCGEIFRMTPEGTVTPLHNFVGPNGLFPRGGLLQATTGVFYGATTLGGDNTCVSVYGCGTLFSGDLGLSPFVAFQYGAGTVGGTVGILGQGFTATNTVLFNGFSASYTVVSDTFIQATVPPGATTGYVTVTTPSGTLKSNVPFHVLP